MTLFQWKIKISESQVSGQSWTWLVYTYLYIKATTSFEFFFLSWNHFTLITFHRTVLSCNVHCGHSGSLPTIQLDLGCQQKKKWSHCLMNQRSYLSYFLVSLPLTVHPPPPPPSEVSWGQSMFVNFDVNQQQRLIKHPYMEGWSCPPAQHQIKLPLFTASLFFQQTVLFKSDPNKL